MRRAPKTCVFGKPVRVRGKAHLARWPGAAVLAGYEKAALSDAALDDAEAARKRNQINQRAEWRERSLLRSAQDDTVARLSAWFARRDGWGG